jgi:hypothetical protein
MDPVSIPLRYRLRVKQRLAILENAVAEGIKPASRRFGLERKTIRRWRDRWLADHRRPHSALSEKSGRFDCLPKSLS